MNPKHDLESYLGTFSTAKPSEGLRKRVLANAATAKNADRLPSGWVLGIKAGMVAAGVTLTALLVLTVWTNGRTVKGAEPQEAAIRQLEQLGVSRDMARSWLKLQNEGGGRNMRQPNRTIIVKGGDIS